VLSTIKYIDTTNANALVGNNDEYTMPTSLKTIKYNAFINNIDNKKVVFNNTLKTI
jgi:hypothetical protein